MTTPAPAPYPPPRKGERMRRIPFPVQRPERTIVPMTAERTDGTECNIRRSLGLPAAPPPDEDEGVVWTRWPP